MMKMMIRTANTREIRVLGSYVNNLLDFLSHGEKSFLWKKLHVRYHCEKKAYTSNQEMILSKNLTQMKRKS